MKALRYNQNKPQWSLVHYKSLLPMIEVLEYGARKYSVYQNSTTGQFKNYPELTEEELDSGNWEVFTSGKDNWKLDMELKPILESMQRHLAALLDGETYDSESGLSHMGHIQCNALFYNYHSNNG